MITIFFEIWTGGRMKGAKTGSRIISNNQKELHRGQKRDKYLCIIYQWPLYLSWYEVQNQERRIAKKQECRLLRGTPK